MPELQWLCKNAYSEAVRSYLPSGGKHAHTMRMLDTCFVFFDCIERTSQGRLPRTGGLHRTQMLCHFTYALTLDMQSLRGEAPNRLAHYDKMRQHILSFSKGPKDIVIGFDYKMCTLLTVNFESAVALDKWDDLTWIVDAAERYDHASWSLQAMGRCLVRVVVREQGTSATPELMSKWPS